MSIETKILALFEEGNPVPDINGLDRVALDATSYLAALRAGSSAMTEVDDKIDRTEQKRPRMVWLAAAAAAVVVILGGVALLQSGDDGAAPPVASEPETTAPAALTPDALPGNDFRVVSGTNQDLPERLAFGEDGTFTVSDRGGFTTDTGTYTIDGDRITFTSVWEEGRGPDDYGVIWAYPVCPGCNYNVTMRTDKCEGVVGEYRLVFDTPGTFSLDLVNDACLLRNYVAKGLELAPIASG